MYQLSPPHSPQSSRPSSPLLTPIPQRSLPFIPPLNPDTHVPQRRLLIPSVRPPRPRISRTRTSRLTRNSRSGSLSLETNPNSKESKEWMSALGLLIVDDQVELKGYQMYAVEKWVVERGRLVNVITVYTGDPEHKIMVTALAPPVSVPEPHAQAEFDKALHILRRDGARPRETDHGIMMVTSLANFRSDYNLVLIPDGNFFAAREQLYVNINLLRMGCSGRNTLTLAEPSEPTKDRYLSMYCFSESSMSKMSFNHAILEMVKLMQCALSLFGMFDASPEERNGLLCDVTVEGITRWTDTIGASLLSLEPMERVGDPSVASALLSVVVATRNKLQALGFTQVPKDPFRDPQGFMQTVSAFQAQAQKLSHLFTAPLQGCLSLQTVEAINDAYDRLKSKGSEYRVARMIVNKIDDLTADLNLRGSADQTIGGHIYATADLATFVQMMCKMGTKDAVESLKNLWTGKSSRRKKTRNGIDEEEREKTDGKSTDDEDSGLFPSWGKQLKIEGLRNFGRSKKPSFDLVAAKTRQPRSLSADEALATAVPQVAPIIVPRLLISESGAENSPHSGNPSSLGISPSPSSHSSNVALESTMTSRVNSRYPLLPKRLPSRFSTASDPTSSVSGRRPMLRHSSTYEERVSEKDEDEDEWEENERRINRGRLLGRGRRRHSLCMGNLRQLKLTTQPMTVEKMKIDVGLCGQFLIMHRRETHLQNIIALLEYLNESLTAKTAKLQEELLANEAPLNAATRLRHEIWSALDATREHLAEWKATRDSLEYQTDQMETYHLWRSVREQRARIFAARQVAFAAPPGARPNKKLMTQTHFRVQSTLDPEELRLVDWLGRTESEVEEEAPIPENEIGHPPPFGEMQAWAAANAREEKKPRKWWWPFGKDNMSDDDTATQSAQAVEDR